MSVGPTHTLRKEAVLAKLGFGSGVRRGISWMEKSCLGKGDHRPMGRFCSHTTENVHRWPHYGFRQRFVREDFMDTVKVNALAN